MKALKIISLLEEVQSFDSETFKKIFNILYTWKDSSWEVKPAQILLLQRYIKDSTYTGLGFRFVIFTAREIVKARIISPDKVSNPTMRDVQQSALFKYLKNSSEYRTRYISWAKSLSGISKEYEMQELRDSSNDPTDVLFLFNAHISGFDLVKGPEFLLDALDKDSHLVDEIGSMYPFYHGVSQDLFDDYSTNGEVLAPLPSGLNLVNVMSMAEFQEP
jgi:hypothetical protein